MCGLKRDREREWATERFKVFFFHLRARCPKTMCIVDWRFISTSGYWILHCTVCVTRTCQTCETCAAVLRCSIKYKRETNLVLKKAKCKFMSVWDHRFGTQNHTTRRGREHWKKCPIMNKRCRSNNFLIFTWKTQHIWLIMIVNLCVCIISLVDVTCRAVAKWWGYVRQIVWHESPARHSRHALISHNTRERESTFD